jgi:hypothetical protein
VRSREEMTTDVTGRERKRKNKIKKYHLTCGSHVLWEIFGDLLEHLLNNLKK